MNSEVRQSMTVTNTEDILSYSYVKFKLHAALADAVVLTELIGFVIGRRVELPELLDETDSQSQAISL